MSNTENQNFQEISLFDLWQIILKRKITISLITLGCIFLVLIGVVLIKPEYQSKAIIKIGQVIVNNGSYKIEEPVVLSKWLTEAYAANLQAELDPADNFLLIVTYKSNTPKLAQSKLKEITKEILTRHQKLYQPVLSLEKKRLKILQEKVKNIDKSLIQNNGDAATNYLMILRSSYEEQITNLESKILGIEWRKTVVLNQPSFSNQPTNKKYSISLMLATMLGLVLGLMYVFFSEEFQKHKNQP